MYRSSPSPFAALSSLTSPGFGFAWMGMLVFDIAIFVLTAARALILSREQRGGLFILLVRDGTKNPLGVLHIHEQLLRIHIFLVRPYILVQTS
jgi:hypothetical protein